MATQQNLYTLQLESKLESLNQVEEFVQNICAQFNADDETFALIMTCLSEVITNAIIHGNKYDLSKRVILLLEVINQKKLVFTITDEGAGFDFHSLPDATDVGSSDNFSGRGLFIVKEFADQCVFNSKGNEVELHFRI